MSEIDIRQIDTQSQTWRAIKDWIESEQVKCQGRLNARGASERDSDFERGALSKLNELLRLPNPSPLKTKP